MTNNNNLIPKENLAKVEEVREINNETPSFEEFMKTYESDKEVVDSYEFEVDSYGDIRTKGTYYGPGFWSDVWTGTKKVGGFALAVSYATPIAPVTMTATLVVGGSALAMEEYGDESWKKVAGEIKDVLSAAGDAQDIGGAAGNTLNNYRSVTRR